MKVGVSWSEMAGSEVTMYKQYGKNVFEEKKVKVEVSWSECAEVAGSKVTVHKTYGKKLFEEKMEKVEGSQSEYAEVAGSDSDSAQDLCEEII